MSSSGYNLPDLFNSIIKHKKVILIISFASAVTGAIFFLVSPKKYEAKTEFILRNPLYGDRSIVYTSKMIDYFAAEDDVNRIILLAGSDLVQMQVIRNTNLAQAYKIDTSTRKGEFGLKKMFEKNMNVIRTEYDDLVLTYTDTDPDRAANVANDCVRVLEKEFAGYYWEMRKNVYEALKNKLNEEDSTISKLTDTLYKLRDKYGIYDIISPTRHNVMSSTNDVRGSKSPGKGIEEIQNIEAMKDETVSDHALKTTAMNEYKIILGDEKQLPMIKVITEAKPPVNHKGLSGLLTVITAGLLGFFFCTVLALITDNVYSQMKK